jgi:hypothetical protein
MAKNSEVKKYVNSMGCGLDSSGSRKGSLTASCFACCSVYDAASMSDSMASDGRITCE